MRIARAYPVLLAVLLFVGCASTRPSADMKSRVPYQFAYEGSEQEAQNRLRRQLSRWGWGVLNTEAGTVAAAKVLSPDEMKSQQVVTGQMAGVGGGGQKGRISLSFPDGDKKIVSMRAIVASEGASARRRESTTTLREHPLLVKMGLRIHEIPGFELTDPPASWLKEWKRTARYSQ